MGLSVLTPAACSWLNVELSINAGAPLAMQTVKKIEWSWKVTSEKAYGAGNKAYDYTDGIIEIDNAKLEIGWSDWVALADAVSILGTAKGAFLINPTVPSSLLDIVASKAANFTVTINYSISPSPGLPPLPHTVTWTNARIVNVSTSNEQGPAAQMVSLEFQVLDIQQSI